MSLIWFHRFLIGAGILFCFGYGVWELLRFLDDGAPSSALIAVAFLALAGGLVYYLRHLRRILGLAPPRRDG